MITVYGSINLDVVSKMTHFPAAGETVLTPEAVPSPGGKGANQAVAAARAGGSVYMVGAVGADGLSAIPLEAFREAGVDMRGVAVLPGATTAIASVMVDAAGENRIVVASNANGRAPALTADHLPPGGTLLMQMEIPHQSNWDALKVAKKRGAKVVLNLAPFGPVDRDVLSLVDILVVNEGEAAALIRHLELDAGSPEAQARALSALGPVTVVTLGSEGYVCVEKKTLIRGKALDVDVVDTTGAGDAFCGCLAAALDGHGMPLSAALGFASAGASLACTKLGAQAAYATKDEIAARLSEV